MPNLIGGFCLLPSSKFLKESQKIVKYITFVFWTGYVLNIKFCNSVPELIKVGYIFSGIVTVGENFLGLKLGH